MIKRTVTIDYTKDSTNDNSYFTFKLYEDGKRYLIPDSFDDDSVKVAYVSKNNSKIRNWPNRIDDGNVVADLSSFPDLKNADTYYINIIVAGKVYPSSGHTTIELTNNLNVNPDNVQIIKGIDGTDGKNGKDGTNAAQIKNISYDNDYLRFHYDNNKSYSVKIPNHDGQDGKGIDHIDFDSTNYNLIINYTDGMKQTLKLPIPPKGEKGEKGEQGVGISGFNAVRQPDKSYLVTVDMTDSTRKYFTLDVKDGQNGVGISTINPHYDDGTASLDIRLTDGSETSVVVPRIKGKDGVGINDVNFDPAKNILTISKTDGSNVGFSIPVGKEGASAFELWKTIDSNKNKTFEDFIASMTGKDGKDGKDGESVYQLWLEKGNHGTEEDFFNSLKGIKGEKGDKGDKGDSGESAYQIWLDHGNHGTEDDFLNSLKGKKGQDGQDGKSAYQSWVSQGHTGTESDFVKSLKGEKGDTGESNYQIWLDNGNQGSQDDFLKSIKGKDGQDGKSAYEIWKEQQPAGTDTSIDAYNIYNKGSQGKPGESAYQIWLDNSNSGTQQDFLDSLKAQMKGDKGDKGDQGEPGPQGAEGLQGPAGRDGDTIQNISLDKDGDLTFTVFNEQAEMSKDVTAGKVKEISFITEDTVYDSKMVGNVLQQTPKKVMRIYYNDATADAIDLPKGEKGDKGDKGDTGLTGQNGHDGKDGKDGKSAYQIWLDNSHSGSETDFLNSLKGEKGDKGDTGLTGQNGHDGKDGKDGKSAYQIWLDNSHTDSEPDFLNSLKGEKGDKGDDGESVTSVNIDRDGYLTVQIGNHHSVKIGKVVGQQGSKGDTGKQGIGIKDITTNDSNHIIITLDDNSTKDVGLINSIVDATAENGKLKITYTNGKSDLVDIPVSHETGTAGQNGKSAYQIWLENGHSGTVVDFLKSLKGDKGDKGDTGLAGQDGHDGKSAYQIWLDNGHSGSETDFLNSLKSNTTTKPSAVSFNNPKSETIVFAASSVDKLKKLAPNLAVIIYNDDLTRRFVETPFIDFKYNDTWDNQIHNYGRTYYISTTYDELHNNDPRINDIDKSKLSFTVSDSVYTQLNYTRYTITHAGFSVPAFSRRPSLHAVNFDMTSWVKEYYE